MHHAPNIIRVPVVGLEPVVVISSRDIDIIPIYFDIPIPITSRMLVSLANPMQHFMNRNVNLEIWGIVDKRGSNVYIKPMIRTA